MDYEPAWYREARAAHAASEVEDPEEDEHGAMQMLGCAIAVAACIVSISAAGVLVYLVWG